MHYSSRQFRRQRSVFSAESLYLLLVVAAAVATAYWAGHSIGVNLSVINTAVSVLGFEERSESPPQVGYAQTSTAAPTSPQAAPYCQPGEQPSFANGMASLHAQVGSAMGAPVECEHAGSVAGDTVQQTSTGLAAYHGTTSTEMFTDGWHHWALGPNGLVTWDGTSADPPTQSATDQASE